MDAWEHFPHPADVGVRGWGLTKAAAFAQCALAVTALIADPAVIAPRLAVPLACGQRRRAQRPARPQRPPTPSAFRRLKTLAVSAGAR